MILSLCSEFVQGCCSSELIESVVLLCKLFFEHGKVLHDGSTVSDVALSHALLLNFILCSLDMLDNVISCIHSHIFKDMENLSVASSLVDTNLGGTSLGIGLELVLNLRVVLDFNTLAGKILLNSLNL